MNSILKYLNEMTITAELRKLGRLNEVTYIYEQLFNKRKIAKWGVLTYQVLLAIPAVAIMRLLPFSVPLISFLSKKIYIERAASAQKKYMKYRREMLRNKGDK